MTARSGSADRPGVAAAAMLIDFRVGVPGLLTRSVGPEQTCRAGSGSPRRRAITFAVLFLRRADQPHAVRLRSSRSPSACSAPGSGAPRALVSALRPPTSAHRGHLPAPGRFGHASGKRSGRSFPRPGWSPFSAVFLFALAPACRCIRAEPAHLRPAEARMVRGAGLRTRSHGLVAGIVAAPCTGRCWPACSRTSRRAGRPCSAFWMLFSYALGDGPPLLVLGLLR